VKMLHFLVDVPIASHFGERGDLGVCELEGVIPFTVKRTYFISNVPRMQIRGQHGHKLLQQVFICIKGNFCLEVTDGSNVDRVFLTQNQAFYSPSGLWRELSEFSEDAICLVLASDKYDVSDYIFDYSEFIAWKMT
jgi:hypothetical protein